MLLVAVAVPNILIRMDIDKAISRTALFSLCRCCVAWLTGSVAVAAAVLDIFIRKDIDKATTITQHSFLFVDSVLLG